MKKLMFVSAFCLLSATTVFGSFKDTIKKAADDVKHSVKNAAHETKKFVDRNINSEKVEKTADDAEEAVKDAAHDVKDGVKNAADETKEFIDRNINSEKVENTVADAKEAVKDAAEKTEDFVKDLSKSEGKKPGQHMHHLKYARVNTILENLEETVTTAYDNAVKHTLPVDHVILAASANSAKSNINNFFENYAAVIEHLQSTTTDSDAFYLPTNLKSSTKPGDLGMCDSDYTNMCDNYNLFITSCMYLTILQDISMHGKSDCINSMGKKHYMLNQLADLMELQSSALSQKELALKTDL